MGQLLDSGLDAQIDKAVLMEALVANPVGVTFLQWLVHLTGHNDPTMSMEDAARRDIWLTIRQHIPIEKLGEIEYQQLLQRQLQVRQLLETSEPQPAEE